MTVIIEAGKLYKDAGGRKIGPMAKTINPPVFGFHWYTKGAGGNAAHWSDNGTYYYPDYGEYSLVAEWVEPNAEPATPSPVRRRTVTEIVGGKYGALDVGSTTGDMVSLAFNMLAMNAAELRAAAATLVALADALDEMAGDSK